MKLTKEQKRRERKRRFKAAKAWLADHWQFNEADAQAKRPGQEILKEDVYQTYLTYCTKDNVDPVANSIFGKALHRVFPGVKSVRKGPRGKAKHHYKYLTQREDIPGADTASGGAPDATTTSVRKLGGAARRKMHMRKKNLNWKTVHNPASPTTKITAGSKRTSAEMDDTPTSPSSLRSFACSSASISDSRGNSHSNNKRSKTEVMSNACVSSTQRTVSSTMNLPLRRSSRKRKAIEIQDEEESEEEEVELTATVQAKKKKRTTRILTDTPPSTTTSATRHNTTITNQEASDDEQPEKGIYGPCGMHSSVPDHRNSNLEFLVKFLDKFDEKKDNNPAHLEKEDAAEAEYPRQATSPYVYTTTTTHNNPYHYPQQLLGADTQSQNTFPKRKRDSSSSSVHSSTVLETSPTLHDSMDEYYFVSPPLHEEYSDSCTSAPQQGFQTNNLWPSSWCSKLWHEIADMKGRYLRYLDSLRGSFAQCCSRGDLEDCRIVVCNFWQDEASRDTYHLFEDAKLRAMLLAAEEDFFCSLVSDTATFDRHFILDFANHMDCWIQQLVLSQVFRADLHEYYRAFSKQVQTHVLYDSDSLFQTRPFIPAQAQLLYSSTSPSASSSFSLPCDSYASMQAFQVRESRGEEEYALWSV